MTDGEREKSIVLDYEAISSVVSDDGQAFIVTSVDSSTWFCITSFGYKEEEETDCTEPLAGKHIGYPIVDVIEGKATLFSEWTTDDQTQGWFLLEQTDRGWELVNEQQDHR
ncbi:MAG: hypothetical protein MR654_06750 [Corynebacterium glucuronolyticum]|nr:hypothetical protein [Corynebacterium glucuronolyticum]